ncbi:MAG TPA: hypothetical protein VJN21_14775 [Candidatus Acidoferrales bacterium]|nr:hypothetical protein [Candidatus Acidoferrales bacterium]
MRRRWFYIGPLAIVAILAFIAVGGEVVRLLWNWLAPALFGWRQITFWQGVGVLALCRILFGSHGFRHSARSNYRRRLAERWANMTPEERDKFRQGFRGCRGRTAPPDSQTNA